MGRGAGVSVSVSAAQRFKTRQPCPVCGGGADMPAGRSVRCYGFISSDGEYAHCTREDAGNLEMEPQSGTYAHRLSGLCRCGATHGEAGLEPVSVRQNGHGTQPRVFRDFREAGAVCAYDYRDEQGAVLFQVWRIQKLDGRKNFLQARPVPGGWETGIAGVRRVLYRLPELLAADPHLPVLLCEGEKDADRLAALGYVATTVPMGAGKWLPEYTTSLAGRRICLLLDNDPDGEKHGVVVGGSLADIAEEVRVLQLPGLPEKGDVSDWLDDGGTPEALSRLLDDAPAWKPAADARTTESVGAPAGVLAANVMPERVRFLWPGRLAAGKLTVMDGDPGLGKSTAALDFAARITTGTPLPGCLGETVPRGVACSLLRMARRIPSCRA
jgi:hypothetical protein